MRHVDAGVLNIPHVKEGPKDGPVAILLHGFPYDILSYVDVAGQDCPFIVPYLRCFGATRANLIYSTGPAKSDAGRIPNGSHFHCNTRTHVREDSERRPGQIPLLRKMRSDLVALRGSQQLYSSSEVLLKECSPQPTLGSLANCQRFSRYACAPTQSRS
ncbi:hypothetical protein IVB27_33455 [Bradyrhizobium sp. 197]|nr:hypothetical protein [Bradyrhizobium sp. 197]